MDPDMNNYDLEHVCTAHPRMSKETWLQVYADAWTRYYSDEHVETVMRRAVASRLSRRKIRDVLTVFSGSVRIEGVHPLQFGIVRRKVRTQRRHGMPIPSPLVFYPRAIAECAKAMIQWGLLWYRYHRMITRIHADPGALSYLDEALRPHSGEAEVDKLVEAFADKIPPTHGAPVRVAAVG